MFQALEWVEGKASNGASEANGMVLFIDSISALEALEGLCEGVRTVKELLTIGERLLRFGVNVTF